VPGGESAGRPAKQAKVLIPAYILRAVGRLWIPGLRASSEALYLALAQCTVINPHIADPSPPPLAGRVPSDEEGVCVDCVGDCSGIRLNAVSIIRQSGSVFDDRVVNPQVAGNVHVVDSAEGSVVILEMCRRELDELQRRRRAAVAISENRLVDTGSVAVLPAPERPGEIVRKVHRANRPGAYVGAASVVAIEAGDHSSFDILGPDRAARTEPAVDVADSAVIILAGRVVGGRARTFVKLPPAYHVGVGGAGVGNQDQAADQDKNQGIDFLKHNNSS